MITVILITLVLIEAAICTPFTNYVVAPSHGGSIYTFECPDNGAITRINYRAASKVDQIEFICTSSKGITTSGSYGGSGGSPGHIACPIGEYISSFYGKSSSQLDRLGIRCRKQSDMDSPGNSVGEFGGFDGVDFDDLAFSRGARPIAITVRAAAEVDAIQITYGYVPFTEYFCTDCSEYKDEWAPKHGGGGGKMTIFECPAHGVITGIEYRSASRVDSVLFTCTSIRGETTVGPFGGLGGTPSEDICPPGSYIGSIYGRSADMVDQLGIRCVKYGQAGATSKRDAHGGSGGQPFDDESYTTMGRRPVVIKVWSGSGVDAIQIKYGNSPINFGEFEVTTDEDIAVEDITVDLSGFDLDTMVRTS